MKEQMTIIENGRKRVEGYLNFPTYILTLISIGLDKQIFECKIVNFFLLISFNICCGCSKEPSHRDGSFEYPQHMFWVKNKGKILLGILNESPDLIWLLRVQ